MQTTEPNLNSPTKKTAIPFLTNILDSMAPKENKNDPFRFQVGVNFKAKIIGIDDVPEARGDRMCQEVIQRQKLAVKASGQHKQQIIMNISLEGIKIIDQASMNAIHQHPVHRISFISRDVSDARAFGYVYGPGDGSHKYFGIKTEKAAENTVLALRDLFQVVFELKKKETEDKKKAADEGALKVEVKSETLQSKKEEEEKPEPAPLVIGTGTSESNQQPAQQQQSLEPDLFGLVDLGTLNKNLEEMSFDPMDEANKSSNPGGEPLHKNPPLGGDLDNFSDPFVVNANQTATSAGWGAFNNQSSAQATSAFPNQPFSPTSSSANSDMFGNMSPFGGAPTNQPAPNSSPFGAPAAAPMSGGPFGAPATGAPGAFGAPAGGAFGAPAGGGFGAPVGGMGGGPFGAPMGAAPAASPFGAAPPAASPFGAPAMGNPMGGVPAQNGPNANPFLSGGGSVSNGFGTLSPDPAPGTEKKEDKPKSVDPFFGDLVGSFSADLGQKKKDEFFKPEKGPKMNELMPQVSAEINEFETDPFDSSQSNNQNGTHSFFSDNELNSPDADIPAPNIPPPPLPTLSTNISSQQNAPSIPPRPSNTMRQTSTSSVSSQISTHSKLSTHFSGTAIDFNLPNDTPPAPPPRPGSRPTASSMGQQVSADSTKGTPSLARQTTLPSVSSQEQQQTPPVPMRKQFSYTLPPDGTSPPPLPTTSPPSLGGTPPVSSTPPVTNLQVNSADTPPPPPPRPGMGSMRAPKLGILSRAMTVPEQNSPPLKSRPRPGLSSDKSTDSAISFPKVTDVENSMQPNADPFAVTLPKPKSSRNADSTIARARPRPRSKTPTQFTSSGFSVKNDSPMNLNNNDDESKDQNTHSGGDTSSILKIESQALHLEDSKGTLESPSGSFRLGNTQNRTGTPISVHSAQSITSGENIIDPFENIDPFEKASEDPFSDEDPFKDVDPFSEVDPFGNDVKTTEFHTKAVSAEGVPLRPDSRNNAERRKKGNAATMDMFSDDPFSITVDPFQGKKLDKPLIGYGQPDTRNSLIDPFDTAFAAATLSTTSVTPQFNHVDTETQQNHSEDIFSLQFSNELNISDSPRSLSGKSMGVVWPDGQVSTIPPLSTSVGSDVNQDILNNDVTNSAHHESDSTSYNSEVSEAFATTPRSQVGQGSTPGLPSSNAVTLQGNYTGVSGSVSTTSTAGNGRATPGNPFLPQPAAPIPSQAPQPPPTGATLLDF